MTENHELITLRLSEHLSKEIDRIMKKTGFADKLKMSVRNVQFHIAQARKKGFEWLRYGGVDGN